MLSACSASPLLSPCTATASFPAVRQKMDLKLGYFCDGIDSKYKPFALHLNRRYQTSILCDGRQRQSGGKRWKEEHISAEEATIRDEVAGGGDNQPGGGA
ncbi:hypothetical protein L1887_35967 [Cichorium endivia]|nr:hypothetical protein L1887_35967 [Cichorium endivia]